MSRVTWNGAIVPTNGDTYDVPGAIGIAIETANVVLPIASQAQRDNLASTIPGGIISDGTVIVRMDVPGIPLERWDAGQWRRGLRYEIGQGANDPSHAAGVSVVTTNASGDATINFPVPFGSVMTGPQITDANDPNIFGPVLLKITYGTSDKTKITFRAYTTAGAALANQSIAISWSADGY